MEFPLGAQIIASWCRLDMRSKVGQLAGLGLRAEHSQILVRRGAYLTPSAGFIVCVLALPGK
jgi:hypothetical protein